MNSTTTRTTTVLNPSRIALPTCGHAVEGTPRAEVKTAAASRRVWGTTVPSIAGVRRGTTSVDLAGAAIKGGMGFAQAYLPGTTAWRPPTC